MAQIGGISSAAQLQQREAMSFFQTGRRLNELQWSLASIEANIAKLGHQLDTLSHNQELLMTTAADIRASQAVEDADIQQALAMLSTQAQNVAALSAQVTALQAQLAAGNPITEADLAGIKADADAQAAAISAVLNPAPATGSTGATGATGAAGGDTGSTGSAGATG